MAQLFVRRHRDSLIVLVWCGLLTLLILTPLLSGGFVLSYDMVWVPQLTLSRPEWWGWGTGLPRAVPSDAVIALLGTVIPQVLLQRIVLFGTLLVAGLGAARLVSNWKLPAQLVAATVAIWSPFVAERLVIGHWPLLIAYACLPWLIVQLRQAELEPAQHRPVHSRHAQSPGPRKRWPVLVLVLAGTAMTPVTGLMGVLVALILASKVLRRQVFAIGVIVNLPWLVPSLLAARQAQTDPAAVSAFAAQGDGTLGVLGSLLTLGGVWNTEVALNSRGSATSVAIWIVLGLAITAGTILLWRRDAWLTRRLFAIAGAGLLLAGLGAWWPSPVQWITSTVPGGGLLRDGSRWVALLMPLYAAALGTLVDTVLQRWRTVTAGVVLAGCALPIAALPDLAGGAAGRLQPVEYPADWSAAAQLIADSELEGDLLSLPFSAFRAPAWNNRRTVLDPAGRFFDRRTVVDDELMISGTIIAGEDPRAAQVRAVLETGDPATLTELGIALAVIDIAAPGGEVAVQQFEDVDELTDPDAELRVFALGNATAHQPPPLHRVLGVGAWLLSGAAVLGALTALGARWLRPQPGARQQDTT